MYYNTTYGQTASKTNPQTSYQTRVHMTQLILSILIFFVVFIGKGCGVQNLTAVYDRLRQVLYLDTDFQSALYQLETSVLHSINELNIRYDLGMEFLFPDSNEKQSEPVSQPSSGQALHIPSLQSGYFFTATSNNSVMEKFLYNQPKLIDSTPAVSLPPSVAETPVVPAAGTILEYIEYPDQPLPDRCTMHRLSLGDLEVVTPVLGRLNSEYGFRTHPIDGKKQFHPGVDIGGQYGDPILAFADGVIDYIGEDDSYGLYMQIDHGNGVKSFYAHCQSLQVKQGQQVCAGDTVGTVGSSGSATGPHLHLELKWNNTRLNPIYYIDVLEA